MSDPDTPATSETLATPTVSAKQVIYCGGKFLLLLSYFILFYFILFF